MKKIFCFFLASILLLMSIPCGTFSADFNESDEYEEGRFEELSENNEDPFSEFGSEQLSFFTEDAGTESIQEILYEESEEYESDFITSEDMETDSFWPETTECESTESDSTVPESPELDNPESDILELETNEEPSLNVPECGEIQEVKFSEEIPEILSTEEDLTEDDICEAEENEDQAELNPEDSFSVESDNQILSFTYINPIYEDIISEEDIPGTDWNENKESSELLCALNTNGNLTESSLFTFSSPETFFYEDYDEAALELKSRLKARETEITLNFRTYESGNMSSIFNKVAQRLYLTAVEHTGVPIEGDYLRYEYGGYKATGKGDPGENSGFYFTIIYTPLYYTTAEQEAEMDLAVYSLLSELNLDGKSDYRKVKLIYDYLCKNVSYDKTNEHDTSYTLKFTGYAALVNKTAVCQGYSVAFYRLCLEAGVDSRIVECRTINHAWNIAGVFGKYYELDVTWDSERYHLGQDGNYFFLRGSSFWQANHSDVVSSLGDQYEDPFFAGKYAIPGADLQKYYLISYDSKGGTGTPVSQEKPHNSAIQLDSMIPAKENMIFAGWSSDPDAEEPEYQPEDRFSENRDTVLYAVWLDNVSEEWNISYELGENGVNDESNPIKYPKYSGNITLAPASRIGYTFDCWYLDRDGSRKAAAPQITRRSEGDLTFYAGWTPNTYHVVFQMNTPVGASGSGTMKDQLLTYDKTGNLYSNQYKVTGYSFVGWSLQQDDRENLISDGGSVQNLTSENEGTVYLFAQWRPHADSVSVFLDEKNVTGQTIKVGLHETPSVTLQAKTSPGEAQNGVRWKSGTLSVAAVDENGKVDFLKPGKVTVTAEAADGSGKKASVQFEVVYYESEQKLKLVPSGENIRIRCVDADGNLTKKETDQFAVYTEPGSTVSFTVTCYTIKENQSGGKTETIIDYPAALSWSSSSSGIAAVKSNGDGTAAITVPAAALGACTVSAVMNDANKSSADIAVFVADKAPRMDVSSVTLNIIKENKVEIPILPSYKNQIASVSFLDRDADSSKNYTASSGDFTVLYDKDSIPVPKITANSPLKNQTRKGQLLVELTDSSQYRYPLSIVVKNTVPSVTVKQLNKFNSLFGDSSAEISISAKTEKIQKVELVSEDFKGEWNPNTERLSVSYKNGVLSKPATKCVLNILPDGYSYPIVKTITLSVSSAKPVLKASASSISINRKSIGTDVNIPVTFTKDFDLSAVETFVLQPTGTSAVLSEAEKITVQYAEGQIGVKVTDPSVKDGTYKYSFSPNYKGVALSPVSVSVKIFSASVSARLKKTTLELSAFFPDRIAETELVLNDQSSSVSAIDFRATGNNAEQAENDIKLEWNNDRKMLVAGFCGEFLPAVNTVYSFDAVPTLSSGEQTAAINLRIKFINDAPKVTLSKTSITLNKAVNDAAYITAAVPEGFRLLNMIFPDGSQYVTVKESGRVTETGREFQVILTEEGRQSALKSWKLSLVPVVKNAKGSTAELKPITLTVNTKTNTKINATVSSSGKADLLLRKEPVIYTVSKTNFSDRITAVALTGSDSELFRVELLDELKDKQRIALYLNEDAEYSLRKTYTVGMQFKTQEGILAETPALRVSLKQSALKFSLEPSSITVFQSQSRYRTVEFTAKLASPQTVNLSTCSVAIGDVHLFQRALVKESENVVFDADANTISVKVTLKDLSKLQTGKSYTLPLEITAPGSDPDASPAKVNLSLKVKK